MLRVVQAREDFGQATGVVIDQREPRALVKKVLGHGPAQRAGGAGDQDMGRVACIAHRKLLG
ncbi:hypothetical protein D9M70_629360 [compost metagenome]